MTNEKAPLVAARIRAEMDALQRVLARIVEADAAIDDPALHGLAVDAASLNIHDFYVGLERLFEAVADNIDGSLPDGANWHRDLLAQMRLDLGARRPPAFDADS